MMGRLQSGPLLCVLSTLLLSSLGVAQFTSSVQGIVQDLSQAGIPKAGARITNLDTGVAQSTTSDANGNFRFVSLAPGTYRITVEAPRFAKSEITITLLTDQNLNVPVTLKVGAVSEALTVSSAAPLVDTADSRNYQTIEAGELARLPLPGRSMLALATFAPGASGLGTMGGGAPGGGGSPGSATDNYSTETQVDASANGQGTMSNMWVVDGLDVTSSIRQGVLNLTPNPDDIQEAATEVNTFSPEYGRASGLQMKMTTKSGTDQFHGLASDYFYYQPMWAGTEFTKGLAYAPFHANNVSATIGGPIVPHTQFFFFFSIEPLRELISTGNQSITYAAQDFMSWAQQNYPSTLGTQILSTYLNSGATTTGVSQTAGQVFGCAAGQTDFTVAPGITIPCSLPMVAQGVFNSTNYRNGNQYFGRFDKYFGHDRIYGSFFRTTLNTSSDNPIPQFYTTSSNWERAFQLNWTHTFSPTILNVAIFAVNRIQGALDQIGDFSVPPITITGQTNGYGLPLAQLGFTQYNYHWRDVLTKLHGSHLLMFGYEGRFGEDIQQFQGVRAEPNFSFSNLATLAQDAPTQETGVMYSPLTGQPVLWEWNAASTSLGLFVEDTWKVRKNLTLNLGLRWDDQGNPYSRNATTVFGNFYLGSGQTFDEQVANGYSKATPHALEHAITNLFSPRIGYAWDPTGKGEWVLRGGAGIFNNWLTSANVQNIYRGNPPGPIVPTFSATGTVPPVFVLGNGSQSPPYGYTYPPLVGSPLCPTLSGANGCLDAEGGIVGAGLQIGGIDPHVKSPQAYIFATTLERNIARRYSASIGYQGAHATDLVGDGNMQGIVSYGVDINAVPGDLIQHESLTPTRLNPSFGEIIYTRNDRESNYNALFFDFRGRFPRGFFDASYTRSRSNDDAGSYPTAADPHQYYGPSPWDVPNRFSLTLNYQLPVFSAQRGFVGHAAGGWGISNTTVVQSGYPFTVIARGPFIPQCVNGTSITNPSGCPSFADPIIGYAPGSGDYNADGDYGQENGLGAPVSLDYPQPTSYAEARSRHAYLTGVFSPGEFTPPAFSPNGAEGNEKPQQFREPNFAESDVCLYKDTHITERISFQVRFDFFNIFNRVNLDNIDNNFLDGTFGQTLSQENPRNWTLGARIIF